MQIRENKLLNKASIMTKQSDNVVSFYDTKFGELNIAIGKNGKPMYCLSDVCRDIRLLKREGEEIVKKCGCKVATYFVKCTKTVTSREFVDESGFLSLVVESRKNNADAFRKWGLGVALQAQRSALEIRMPDSGYYPSISEYFKDYVPASEFLPIIDALLISFKKDEHKATSDPQFVLSVVGTFRETLAASIKS